MGKKLADSNFTNRLFKSTPFLFSTVAPTPLSEPSFLHINFNLLSRLGIDEVATSNPSFLRFCNGDLSFEGLFFGASVYAGHQFGFYVPRLGDGRAITLAELKEDDSFYELQLKGSGLTPYSRMGDGKAVVRSCLREYLASAHLKALSIPTTEALAIIKGEDDVYREEIEKSSIVLRVAESFLRFGHFQYLAHNKKSEELKRLVDFVIEHYFSTFFGHPNQYVLFYQEVVKRTAKLFASWQALGFCHGVLNTDNMSILGLTIDYGPFGFSEVFDNNFICNHSDHEGRYSFGNQPGIGYWNLQQLANSLTDLIAAEDLERTLDTYPKIFSIEYKRHLLLKCGIYNFDSSSDDFLNKTLAMLEEMKIDYTQFFRSLCYFHSSHEDLRLDQNSDQLRNWLKDYKAFLWRENLSDEERCERLLTTNPKYILRNYLAQYAIEDHSLIKDLFLVLSDPYKEWPEFHSWSLPAPLSMKNLSVTCSS